MIAYIAYSDNFQSIPNSNDDSNTTDIPTTETETEPVITSSQDYDELVEYTLELINLERMKRGLANVSLSL